MTKSSFPRRSLLAGTMFVPLAAIPVRADAAPTATRQGTAHSRSVLDFGAIGDGQTNDRAAFQACVDSVADAGGGTVVVPAARTYVINDVVEVRDNILIQGPGATITKTQQLPYSVFVALSRGRTGHGSGVRNFGIQGIRFLGNFADGIGLCVGAFHHADGVTITDCDFDQCQRAGHVFDLCGCQNVSIRHCTFRGFQTHNDARSWPSTETIELDCSVKGALSHEDDDGSHDGLFTRRVTVEDCNFESLRTEGTFYPAPNVIGAHAVWEQHWYEDVTVRRVRVNNPVEDSSTAATAKNQGIIHFPSVKRLLIEDVTVSTTDPHNTRVMEVLAATEGRLMDSDPNTSPSTTGVWIVPNNSEDITLRRLSVTGFSQAPGAANPKTAVRVVGASAGRIQRVRVEDCEFHHNFRALSFEQSAEVTLLRTKDCDSQHPLHQGPGVVDFTELDPQPC